MTAPPLSAPEAASTPPAPAKKVALGCDEAAYQLKEVLKQHLHARGMPPKISACKTAKPRCIPMWPLPWPSGWRRANSTGPS